MSYSKAKSLNDSPGGPLMARVGYVLKTLQWDGNVLTIARRFILKQWKYRLLGILLLIPLVYILSASKLVLTTEPATSRKHHNSLYPSTMASVPAAKYTPIDYSSHKETLLAVPPGMSRLKWVNMSYGGVENVFVVISAYYDHRPQVRGRPGIVIMAYEKELVPKPHLKCVFTYPNGSKSCHRNAPARQENVDCLTPAYKTKKVAFRTIVCPLRDEDDVVPVKVQLSFSGHCEDGTLSGEIPVSSQPRATTEEPSKRIGVCLQGSLRAGIYENVLQSLNNFISMSEYLGAEFITMYVTIEEVDARIVRHLLANHSRIVNLVEWKVFEHDYNGQFGIIYDCLYRHMHEAKYLAFFDLDEMIMPFKHNNWLEMLDELEARGGDAYPGYSFLNRMYTKSNLTNLEMLGKCPGIDRRSVYLTWLKERQCVFKHTERSKMILSPTRIIHTHIHKICRVVGNRNLFLVDKHFAINAHYRKEDLWMCFNYFTKDMFDWFRELLDKYTNSICKVNQ